jgi:Uma2 family endonuclease
MCTCAELPDPGVDRDSGVAADPEVLSPSNPSHTRFIKRRRHQEARVPLYWIVDGEERAPRSYPAPQMPRLRAYERADPGY